MSTELSDLMKKAEALSTDEQLRLIAHLATLARTAVPTTPHRRAWREIAGVAPYPLAGEDAQAWVSRTRHEGDERRAKQWTSHS